MAEYIDAEPLKKEIADFKRTVKCDNSDYLTGYICALSAVEGMIAEQPAADVEPVRRGKWLKTDAYPHRVYCSECYKTYVTNEEVIQGRGWAPVYCTEAEFCPHCGAKMGGEENGK